MNFRQVRQHFHRIDKDLHDHSISPAGPAACTTALETDRKGGRRNRNNADEMVAVPAQGRDWE